MDRAEARQLLDGELERMRRLSYADLRVQMPRVTGVYRFLGATAWLERGGETPRHHEVLGPSGTRYMLEVALTWEDEPEGNIHVSVSIDDGKPGFAWLVSDGFVISPNGQLSDG